MSRKPSRKQHNAPRSPLLTLIGRLVCRWKGGHKWRRVKGGGRVITGPGAVLQVVDSIAPHSVCTRCGITRPIKTRAKRVKQGVAQ